MLHAADERAAQALDRARDFDALDARQQVLERQLEDAKASGRELDLYELATYQLGAGQKEQALDSLEKALTLGPGMTSILWLKAEPTWDPLRAEPRFKEILRKIGLPE